MTSYAQLYNDARILLALLVASSGGELKVSFLPLRAKSVPKVVIIEDPMRSGVIVRSSRTVAPMAEVVNWRNAFRGGGQE